MLPYTTHARLLNDSVHGFTGHNTHYIANVFFVRFKNAPRKYCRTNLGSPSISSYSRSPNGETTLDDEDMLKCVMMY